MSSARPSGGLRYRSSVKSGGCPVLWYRELTRDFDLDLQRKVFFPEGTPLYAYLPSHVQHCATLLWDFGIRGKGRPAFGRLAGVGYAAIQLWFSLARQLPRLRTASWRS